MNRDVQQDIPIYLCMRFRIPIVNIPISFTMHLTSRTSATYFIWLLHLITVNRSVLMSIRRTSIVRLSYDTSDTCAVQSAGEGWPQIVVS